MTKKLTLFILLFTLLMGIKADVKVELNDHFVEVNKEIYENVKRVYIFDHLIILNFSIAGIENVTSNANKLEMYYTKNDTIHKKTYLGEMPKVEKIKKFKKDK